MAEIDLRHIQVLKAHDVYFWYTCIFEVNVCKSKMNGLSDTENTGKGFEGCIYRMQIDNIYPLKRAFQDPRPSFIKPVPEGNRKLSLSSLSQWNTCYFYNIRCLISLFYCILYSVKIPFQINISFNDILLFSFNKSCIYIPKYQLIKNIDSSFIKIVLLWWIFWSYCHIFWLQWS